MTFEIVVRRVRGLAHVTAVTPDLATACALRNAEAARLMQRGFSGSRNAAGVWRLSKQVAGRRVRLAVYIRPDFSPRFSLN